MEIGRDAEELEHGHSSIQLLQMPWTNISSRQSSRQASQDPFGRPQSRDSMKSGRVLHSSISYGIVDDIELGRSSPPQRRDGPRERIGGASGTCISYCALN
jgi:hypothetical protein